MSYQLLKRLIQVNSNGTQTVLGMSKKDYSAAELNGVKTLEAVSIQQNEPPRQQFNFNPGQTISGLPTA